MAKKEIEKKIGKEGRKQVSLKKEVRRLPGKKERREGSKKARRVRTERQEGLPWLIRVYPQGPRKGTLSN